MAVRHAAPRRQGPGLLRASVTATLAGAALVAGAGTGAAAAGTGAAAATSGPLETLGQAELSVPMADFGDSTSLSEGVKNATTYGIAPAKTLKLNPLAGTGVDPLDNKVDTQVADFQPVSTGALTSPLASGASLDDLPVAGPVSGVLPG
ncbi:hypothetical protein [Streptomyces sp. NPDC002851]